MDKIEEGKTNENSTVIASNNNSNGSPDTSPGRNGTILCFFLFTVGLIVSIITYVQAPSNITLSAWNDGCPSDPIYEHSCKANSAVLRISCAMTIVFGTLAICTRIYTKFYDILLVVKFVVFIALVIGFFFGKSSDFGLDGYAWLARITGFFFLILQQVILLDVAYSWNEKWLEYAGGPEGEKGNFWLVGIIVISLLMFMGSYSALGVMYWQFGECTDSLVIISLTLCLSFIATVTQLFISDEGSILTSAIMTSYGTYICYSAVTLNPNTSCNLTFDSGYQTLSIVIGLTLTVISLLWTTYNVVSKFPHMTDTDNHSKPVDVMHIAVGTIGTNSAPSSSPQPTVSGGDPYATPIVNSLLVQVSIVFLLVSGYYAMVLTNWATVQANASISNPRTGGAAMWIQAAGQWISILMYLWSLVAPKILTNRDFSS